MIPQETVNKILDTAQIVDVISDFVTLKRHGKEYAACCPFHNEKTPSFYVNPAKEMYYCFGCHKGGSAIGFVMEYEHLTYAEALRYLGDIIAVAHPRDALLRQSGEQAAGRVVVRDRLAVFARRALLRGADAPTELMRHELTAVADAEDRYAQREQRRVDLRRAGGVNAVRPAGKDDAGRPERADRVERHGIGMQLAVHTALAHAARDELIVLSAEV